jgi:hypothetical protein
VWRKTQQTLEGDFMMPASATSPVDRGERRQGNSPGVGPLTKTLSVLLIASLMLIATSCVTAAPRPASPLADPAGRSARASGAASDPPKPPSLPARPTNLSLVGVAPCGLLVGPAVAQLGVGPGVPYGSIQEGDAECLWSSIPAKPGGSWLARTLIYQSADTALSNPDAQVIQIAGFPAVQTSDPTADPTHSCELYIDVAPNQSLLVTFVGNDSTTTVRQGACQQAVRAATAMVTTLGTIQKK